MSPPFTLGNDGLLDAARLVSSPNFDERPDPADITLAVIHSISLPPGEYGGGHIELLFTNRLDSKEHPYFATIADLKVSAHFLVARNGDITQFVPCQHRAWHAGESSFEGRSVCNDFSVGIELEGAEDSPFGEAQYVTLVELANALIAHYPIAGFVGHADIAPQRKTDPGPAFDWNRLFEGIGRQYDRRG